MPRHEESRTSLMLVSASSKTAEFISHVLSPDRFSPILAVQSASEARRAMTDSLFDIVLIRPPLPDDLGMRLAEDLVRYETTGVLLLVGAEQYEQISRQAEDLGIMILARPVDKHIIQQALGLLVSMKSRLRKLERRAETLQAKMEEIRLVNRAKLILVERLSMSESEAHRFIEKNAMDRCVKRREVAEGIIGTYEN